MCIIFFFLFKQKTSYEMRISDWSSDVCSSDLRAAELSTEWLGPRTELEIQRTLLREVDQERWTSLDRMLQREARDGLNHVDQPASDPKLRQQRVLQNGRASCRERVCQDV